MTARKRLCSGPAVFVPLLILMQALLIPGLAQPAKDYCDLNFSARNALATVRWMSRSPRSGDSSIRQNVAQAVGRMRLPKNCSMMLTLKYDALENIEQIEQFAQLKVITVTASKLDLTDSHLQHLQHFKEIKNLNLGETLVSDKSLPLIGTLDQLQELSLSRTDVTGSGFESLSHLPNLTKLNLTGLALKSGSLIKLKAIFPKLEDLDLTGDNLSRDDGPAIACLSRINSLDLSNNPNWGDDCAQYLSQLKELRKLSISGTKMTDKSLPLLSKLPGLKQVCVRPSSFWSTGSAKNVKAGLKIIDVASKSNFEPEVFAPLH